MNPLKRARSVRFTLTLWYSVLLTVAFTLFGGSTYLYLRHMMIDKLDQDLIGEVDWISQIIDLDRSRLQGRSPDALSEDVQKRIAQHFDMNPFNYIVVLTSTRGVLLYESNSRGQEGLLGLAIQSHRTILTPVNLPSEGTIRVASLRADPFVIQVAYSDQTVQAVLQHIESIFIVLAPVVLFVAFAGGWVMAGLILRPIRSITSAAERITAKNLTERIPARRTKDELGRLIETMNGMIARLQTSFDQVRQFSMNVAHELKTPLTILKGESELALSRPMTSAETRELVNSYLEETIRMSRVVDDLLTLAKADAGQIPVKREPVSIDQLLSESYEDAQLLSSGKDLHVKLDVRHPAMVLGDESRLRQLFRILLTNAIQFTNRGGSIVLRVDVAKDGAIITFEDTGIGIPAESIERIFDRFYRVEQARTRSKGGSGLGLSLAKWIVETHDGTISVHSEPGKGSEFSVRLPLYHPTPHSS